MLIGRHHELEFIATAVADGAAGPATVVDIVGEPGLGKTALLGAVARAVGPTTTLVALRCAELTSSLPFRPLLDAIGQLGPAGREAQRRIRCLLAAPAGQRSTMFEDLPELRTAVAEEAVSAIETLCLNGSVVVTVDDAQWADDATLLAVDSLLQRASDLALLVVMTRRPGPDSVAHDLSDRWQRSDVLAYQRVDLSPLDQRSTTELAAHVLGRAPDSSLGSLLDGCDGNPLLVVETLDDLVRHGAFDPTDGSLRSSTPSARLSATVLRRMGAVDPDDRPIIEMAALLGARFTIGELAQVSSEEAPALRSVCRRATQSGLLVEDGDGYTFRHDMVRSAIEANLDADLRVDAHARIADTLRRANAPSSIVAEHRTRGTSASRSDSTTAAVGALHGAAIEIMSQDPGTASRLLVRALARTSDKATMLPIRTALVDALGWSGRPGEAADLAESILATPLPDDLELAVRAAFSRALVQQGRTTEAVANAVAVRSLVARTDDIDGVAWADAQLALCHLLALELAEALSIAAAVPDNDGTGDGQGLDAMVLARCVEALCLTVVGSSAEGVARARLATAAADRSRDASNHRLHPNLFLGIALQSCGEQRPAADCFRRSRELGEMIGADWAQPLHHLGMALTHWDAGRLDDLLAEVDAAVRSGEERGSVIGRVWAHAVAARAELHHHRIERAEAHITAADAIVANGGPQFGLDWLMLARSHVLAATGQPADAVALLTTTIDAAAALGSKATLVLCGADLCAMAHACGDTMTARRVALDLENYARRAPGDRIRTARAQRARGISYDEVEMLERAAAAFGGLGFAVEEAATWIEVAERVPRRRALPLSRAALDRFLTLGVPALAERAQAIIDHHEPRRSRSSGRSKATSGWEALTPTEWLIVAEVCAGRSNGEAATSLRISRRTVEAHLRSIYTKLGIKSRVALVVERNARAQVGPPDLKVDGD